MSSVIWYYSVNGKTSSPHTWEELCTAVKENKVGPNDLVWTSAFGREWRKASTLEGLFTRPKEEDPKISENTDNSKDDFDSVQIEEQSDNVHVDDASEDFFENPSEVNNNQQWQQQYYYLRKRVGIRLGLKRAYRGMLNVLFVSPFNILRWIPFALAFFLASQLSVDVVSNAQQAIASGDSSIVQKFSQKSAKLKMPEGFFNTGVFSQEFQNDYKALNKLVEETQKNKNQNQDELSTKAFSIYGKLLNNIGETSYYLWGWMRTPTGGSTVLFVSIFIFCIKLMMMWFGSKGKFIAMARCYNPTEPFGLTWRRVASSSNRFFRMVALFEFVFSLMSFVMFILFVRYLANGYVFNTLSVSSVILLGFVAMIVFSIMSFIKSYLRNFVALPILLENERLTFGYIFKGLGLWVVRYGIIYSLIFFLFQSLLVIIAYGFVPLQLLLMLPVTRELMVLPIYLTKLLWTMDITVQIRPELARKRPPVDPMQVNR